MRPVAASECEGGNSVADGNPSPKGTGLRKTSGGSRRLGRSNFHLLSRRPHLGAAVVTAGSEPRHSARARLSMATLRLELAAAACWLALGASLDAGGWRCPACGSCELPCRVRRLVPDVERVMTYEYFNRYETWCVQGPSRCVGEVRKKCGEPNPMVPQFDKIWQPTCGPSFTCARLWKRPVVVERPVLRCVIEDKCSHCGVAQAAQQAHPLWAIRKKPSATQVAAGQPARAPVSASAASAASTPAAPATLPAAVDTGPSLAAPGPSATLPHWFSPSKIE